MGGTSRAACQEISDSLGPFRAKDDVVIGMMMREPRNLRREDVFRGEGLTDVHEDVFSTDRLQDPELRLRDKGTRNAIVCFLGYLQAFVDMEGNEWNEERSKKLEENAMKELDAASTIHLIRFV